MNIPPITAAIKKTPPSTLTTMIQVSTPSPPLPDPDITYKIYYMNKSLFKTFLNYFLNMN